MLRSRIIPCLLIDNGAVVKTEKFSNPKYIGDPLNAVKIFNEKKVDELIVLDISCTRDNKPPDEKLISRLASECRMPLCYGGGIKNIEQYENIISLGVEKIAVGSLAVTEPKLVSTASSRIGSQSIIVVIDIKRKGFSLKQEVVINNGNLSTNLDPVTFAKKMVELGAGEIVLNFVDRDGTMVGYDLDYIHKIKKEISVPLTVLGGANSLEDIKSLVNNFKIIGAAAGSIFVFKGKYRAVLINYPSASEKYSIIEHK